MLRNRPERRPPRRRVLLSLLAPLAGLAAACREELGPERFPTTTVSGKVLEGGQPVGGGWIEFFPVEGTIGKLRSARIRADGTFEARGVAIGTNALRLVHAPIRMPGGARLFGSYATPLRRRISEHPEPPLEIELVEEALRYQAQVARGTQ